MDVQLYVYDLTNGLARQMSVAFLGTYIDAVYHTSIVFKGVEYVYDGGIKTVQPGKTHLGPPLEVRPLGKTDLSMEIIMEYLESMKEVFTVEAYDLWTHNCNNFSNDFATFLTGNGIPSHITNLPQTVLESPFGRILKPQVDQIVNAKKQRKGGSLLGINTENAVDAPATTQQKVGAVRRPESLKALSDCLDAAKNACAVIFFTSATCPPCKQLYPLFDELAANAGNSAVFIKIDIAEAFDIATKYDVKATPTFITFLHGSQEKRWVGSSQSTLRGNVQLLLHMAWPPHPHESLKLPVFLSVNTQPVLYSKIPPLAKLRSKMGVYADTASVKSIMQFVAQRESSGAAEAHLPDLNKFSRFLRSAPSEFSPDTLFTVVDLLRVALIDPRFSGYYAEEKGHGTIAPLLGHINNLPECPYSLRLVALQTACNLFSSPLYPTHILGCPPLTTPIVSLITSSLLDSTHHNVRVAAASLSFNIAVAHSHLRKSEHKDVLPEGDQVELVASLLEAIGKEENSPEALKGFLLALGYLVYCAPAGGEMRDLLVTLDASTTVKAKGALFSKEKLVGEIGEVLLGEGML